MLVFRQFNCCLYLEMQNSFVISPDVPFLLKAFEMSKKAFAHGELSFSLEILTRLIISVEGMQMFLQDLEFLESIKHEISVKATQIIKEKILHFFELSICSKKVDLKKQKVTDHFSMNKHFSTFMYYIFFNSVHSDLDRGIIYSYTILLLIYKTILCKLQPNLTN